MRVTFDSNTFRKAVCPNLFPRDSGYHDLVEVHDALSARRIEGFICATMITVEGIPRTDRASVFAGTALRVMREIVDNEVHITAVVEQPGRQPLHPIMASAIQAALALGVRVIDNPRVGTARIDDPDGCILAPDTNLSQRLDKYCQAAAVIEARGLGFPQLTALAKQFARRDNVCESWYRSLERARDVHERRKVERSFAEWCDADTVAAHIGYSIDVLCTEDLGRSAGGPSVFDAQNRRWLQATFDVKFVSLDDLAALV